MNRRGRKIRSSNILQVHRREDLFEPLNVNTATGPIAKGAGYECEDPGSQFSGLPLGPREECDLLVSVSSPFPATMLALGVLLGGEAGECRGRIRACLVGL